MVVWTGLPGSFAVADAFIMPSRFLSELYHRSQGVDSTPLPMPVWPYDVVAARREPAFFTSVSPSIKKGCVFPEAGRSVRPSVRLAFPGGARFALPGDMTHRVDAYQRESSP